MKVSHYFEWEEHVTGGHAQSVANQRTIMAERGIEYTTEPTLDADVLHLNNMGPRSIYWARKARKRGVPVLVHAHQTAEDFRESFVFSNVLSRPLKPYLQYAYSLADHLICPSEHNREVIESYSDAPKSVVSNGFDPGMLAGHEDLRDAYLERYDLEPPVVFLVAHVIKRKGLAAFVETARAMPELDFAWFGYLNPTGGTFGRLLQSRDTMRLVEESPENCTFTGFVDDVRGAYAAGDVFFFPTKNENEGMALLEAMSCGTPPVVRDIPTFEWLADGDACLKAESDFTEPLARLAADDDLRERIGAAARERSESFTLDAVGDDLEAVYRGLV